MTIPPQTAGMPGVGRDKAVTAEQIFELMERSDRPVWSAKDVGDHFDVSTPTARDRLQALVEHGWVESIQVSQVPAYYVPGSDDLELVERHKQSLVREYTDKFVGLPRAPWTAVHPNDGPAEAGDKVQLRVDGEPGRWRSFLTHAWPNRRDELVEEETISDETQALISGELYAKPTVPIEHSNYDDDYDLEGNIGAEFEEVDVNGYRRQILIASGLKNYLIMPCNEAVFLTNVSVDWISPKGVGVDETADSTLDLEEKLEMVEEWREEHIEDEDAWKDAWESEDPGL